jgi:hypothetical protein
MDEVFRSGTLNMSASPYEGLAADPLWTDILTNRILAVAAVVLMMVHLLDLLRLLPHLLYSYSRVRGAESLEHSLGTARLRNLVALSFSLPFCLILDRFAVLQPAFREAVPPAWGAPATVGFVAAYVLVRGLLHAVFHPRRMSGEVVKTLRHNHYNYLLLLVLLMLLVTAVAMAAHLDDTLVRSILRVLIAAVWGFATLRSGQILIAHGAGFSTFLYLCGLEILPAALLVAVVVFF